MKSLRRVPRKKKVKKNSVHCEPQIRNVWIHYGKYNFEGCSSHIDPMFSGYFLQFHSMFSLYFGWWNLDIECNAHHYMYLVHQNKLMTFCGFGMKTTSFGPPSCRLKGALKKHNLYMHAIAPHHCLSPPTTTAYWSIKIWYGSWNGSKFLEYCTGTEKLTKSLKFTTEII